MNPFPAKRRLLICTIARGCVTHLDMWWVQLANLSRLLYDQGYSVELSCVENDSIDGTAEWLRNRRENWLGAPCPFLKAEAFHLLTEKLGTRQYGSVWDAQRLRQLAAARQKCLDQMGSALGTFDKIAYVEPDITYDPAWIGELVLANHPRAAGLGEPDVYSGWSLRSASHPKESLFLYDTCATRAGPNDTCWDVNEDCGRWRGRSLIPTGLPGVEGNCLHHVWSTFNGFCVYNAKPFIGGELEGGGYHTPVRWDYVNRRLNNGQPLVENQSGVRGYLEADTVAVCEDFRARGYNGIYLNTNCLVRHA